MWKAQDDGSAREAAAWGRMRAVDGVRRRVITLQAGRRKRHGGVLGQCGLTKGRNCSRQEHRGLHEGQESGKLRSSTGLAT